MEHPIQKKIIRLIVREQIGKASSKELRELHDWIEASEGNRLFYERETSGKAIREYLQHKHKVEEITDYARLSRKLLDRAAVRQGRKRLFYSGWTAAVCVLVFVITLIWWTDNRIPTDHPNVSPTVEEQPYASLMIIRDGVKQAFVFTEQDTLLTKQEMLVQEEGVLHYYALPDDPGKNASGQTTIVTATEGVVVNLEDGTQVWLNASSSLHFPPVFECEHRIVVLEGEAFFDVTPDPERQFVVRCGEIEVKVLGTSFNVQAYADESIISTTVEQGRVEVFPINAAGQSVVLTPGMQSQWDKTEERLSTQTVNPQEVMAWRTGNYIFKGEQIDRLLRVLARWYGVEFEFESRNLEQNTFYGRFRKGDDLRETLRTLERMGGPGFEFVNEKQIKILQIK